MPLPPLPTKTTLAAIATKATPTCTSSSSSTAQPVITTNDNNNNSPTPPAGRKIRIISSCNYTNPMIRLNLKNLNPKTVTSTTTASPASAPKTPVRDQVPKVQAASHSVSSSFPVSTSATPDPSQASLTSTSKQTTPMKSTQTVVNTIKSSNSTYSSNGSSSNSNFSLSPDYDGDLSDKAGTTDEPDPDPDLHHRRRLAQPQLNRSPSLPHPHPLLTEQQNQSQEPEVTSSVDGEDPFKELGLKPYSPIWLSSRTPSFEMMRQRSYSPNPRHRMTICPSQVQDDDDVIGKDDREILGFDLHEPLKEEVESTENQITAAGNETQEPGSNHRYERFGSIKKRPSPLLPNHYDDLEDQDAEEVNLQMVDAKTIMLTTKRPKRDHAQDQSHAPPPPPLLRPHANNSNIGSNHAEAESGEIDEGPDRTHHNGECPFPPFCPDNNNSNDEHPYRQQRFGNQRLPPSQHNPQPYHQLYPHRRHSQQHENFQSNNYSYDHYHYNHNHPINRPYQSRPWTTYRGNNYRHPGEFHHTRDGSHPGNGGDGDEGSFWFRHERAFIGRWRGRGRGFGRGRGRGRGGYGNPELYNRYHFPPRQGGSHGTDPSHQQQYEHRFEDEDPMIDARPLEITNGTSTSTGTVIVSDPSSGSRPPPPSPPRGPVTDSHPPPSSSSLSIASSSRTTLHLSPNLNHHMHASAQRNEKHSQDIRSNNTESSKPPLPLASVPSSSAETKSTVTALSKSKTSTTTSLSYSFPPSLRTPSPPPQPVFISYHSTSPHNSISPSKSFSRSPSRSLSESLSKSRSPSPATLASSAQTRLTRYAASEISSLAQKLITEQTLRVQAQKQIQSLTQSLRDLEERNQLVEQNYEVLLAKYRREVRK
ncbi:hypothetical protein BKA57DRAFT_442022 [Linnemannia elongata]|nr:hypothetical protein BKA57DRAFT_442022 [Linnemannia elongata]